MVRSRDTFSSRESIKAEGKSRLNRNADKQ